MKELTFPYNLSIPPLGKKQSTMADDFEAKMDAYYASKEPYTEILYKLFNELPQKAAPSANHALKENNEEYHRDRWAHESLHGNEKDETAKPAENRVEMADQRLKAKARMAALQQKRKEAEEAEYQARAKAKGKKK